MIDKNIDSKPFKLKLKYYQCFCLFEILQIVKKHFGTYEKNIMLQIRNEIHPQL